MLDLPGQPFIDKSLLIGGCARLPLTVDARRLAAEVAALAPSMWGSRGGRGSVHDTAEAIFLRGHAPSEGELPIEDRAALAQLPYARAIVHTLIPAPALRCLLARLPGGAVIAPHIDRAPYFAKSLRLHVPVETHDRAWMIAGERRYRMAVGEVWALDNSAPHAVENHDPHRARTHLICDFLPTAALVALLARAERTISES
ncbi:MAG: aspartyl/asparaginyl beta-hydroxylase domain-containing protein [Steroidobacteraceae bacterium]